MAREDYRSYTAPLKDRELVIGVDEAFSSSYEKFLEGIGAKSIKFVSFKDIYEGGCAEKVDMLLFTGGADVDPKYYGEDKGARTGSSPKRDKLESSVFENYYGVAKLGICRGSQLLTVLNGGKLVQDVNNHAISQGHHITYAPQGRNHQTFLTTSTHHQMMFPYNLKKGRDYELLAWSTKHLGTSYLNGLNEEIELPTDFLEPEIVFYQNSRSLAVQGHPEFVNAHKNFKHLIQTLIKKHLL
tara:strand:+ start:642 stop:1367 length:726 start_codon:yes stop_codon:yes gene_type:complete